MIKVGLVSLGCAKNLVDSEMILGMLDKSNFKIVSDPKKADAIIINTCGFISDSKKESINTIFEMAKYHKKLFVTGCLVERYKSELEKEIKEVTRFISISEYHRINDILKEELGVNEVVELSPFTRILTTPKYSAYLRISEGCNNVCTFCAIPLIRGRFRSRSKEDVLKEADILLNKGIKELVIISQDVTRYGTDFDYKYNLVDLLKDLEKKDFYSIRLLYLYPDEISDELIELIAKSKKIAHYFDVPIQHANSRILKNMNRRGDKEFLYNLFKKIKTISPDSVLRTTLIVGFPGETKDDFLELKEFIKEIKFDHLGCFAYSKEEGTKSYNFPHQVRSDIKEKRKDEIMEIQEVISYEQNKKHLGEIMEGIVTNYDNKSDTYYLRSYFNAPDDIDGNIMFTSNEKLEIGDIVKVKITNAFVYDLFGEKVS